jgi:hypothetical protein
MNNDRWSIRAMFREFLVGIQQIIAAHDLKEEVVLHIAELVGDLLATYVERRHKEQRPRRRGPHPVIVELLARLDRYFDCEDGQGAASGAAA